MGSETNPKRIHTQQIHAERSIDKEDRSTGRSGWSTRQSTDCNVYGLCWGFGRGRSTARSTDCKVSTLCSERSIGVMIGSFGRQAGRPKSVVFVALCMLLLPLISYRVHPSSKELILELSYVYSCLLG